MKQKTQFYKSVRIYSFVILASILVLVGQTPTASARYAAIVLEADSGRVLYAVNPDTRNFPASLTKMMTLYMVFDALESGKLTLDQKLTVSRRASGMAPSKLGVKKGEIITVETVILALVTKSANDAAVVVAEALGGSEAKFARMMTKKARALGMRRTTFRNASGLPNRRQLTTARDMALLSRHLVRDFPKRYRYFSTKSYKFRGREYKNHNALLRTYRGADGIKTGYIRASGFNLAASVLRGNKRLIAVVLGGRTARSRDRHMARLLDREFNKIALNETRRPRAVTPPKRPLVAAVARPAVKKRITRLRRPPVAKIIRRDTVRKPQRPKIRAKIIVVPKPKTKEWSIQVGAYGTIDPARKAVRKAISRIPKLTGDTRISIAPYYAGDKIMYRARLIGLTDAIARSACKLLERRKIPCIAIPPDQAARPAAPKSQTATRLR